MKGFNYILQKLQSLSISVVCVLISLSSIEAMAQPGESLEYMLKARQDILKRLPLLDAQIKDNPNDAQLFETRGAHYFRLYQFNNRINWYQEQTEKIPDDPQLAKKGLADFKKAIELKPQAKLFAQRGNLYALLWHIGMHNKVRTSYEKAGFDEIVKSSDFYDKATADFLEAARLSSTETDTQNNLRSLAYHYSTRGSRISWSADWVGLLQSGKYRKSKHMVCADLDKAIEVGRKVDNWMWQRFEDMKDKLKCSKKN